MPNKYQSVIQFRGFWSVQFSLSIRSSKFPSEIFHTKFDLLYFAKEMFNGKEIRNASSTVPIQ